MIIRTITPAMMAAIISGVMCARGFPIAVPVVVVVDVRVLFPQDRMLVPTPSVMAATRHSFRNVLHRNGGANRNCRVRWIAGEMASAAEKTGISGPSLGRLNVSRDTRETAIKFRVGY